MLMISADAHTTTSAADRWLRCPPAGIDVVVPGSQRADLGRSFDRVQVGGDGSAPGHLFGVRSGHVGHRSSRY